MSSNVSATSDGCRVTRSRDHIRPLAIAVEGNIGSGKSTFLDYCGNKHEIDTFKEPISKWTNVDGVNLLAKYYEEPRRYAFAFQMQVNMTTLDIYKQRTWRPLKFVERHCFVENLKRSGVLEPVMGSVLDGWYQRVNEDRHAWPDAMVYLRTSPAVAHERLVRRARPEETVVTLAYLQQLHRLHEEMVGQIQSADPTEKSDFHVYVIDADQSIDRVRAQCDACLDYMYALLVTA